MVSIIHHMHEVAIHDSVGVANVVSNYLQLVLEVDKIGTIENSSVWDWVTSNSYTIVVTYDEKREVSILSNSILDVFQGTSISFEGRELAVQHYS